VAEFLVHSDTICFSPVAQPPNPTVPARGDGTPVKAAVRRQPSSRSLVFSTIKYLMRTDVHTFAFSVAANSILSFFPFVVLMMTLIRRVFHSRVMYEVVVQLLRDYLPAGQDFVIRNLNSMVNSRQRVQAVSLVILLVPATFGIERAAALAKSLGVTFSASGAAAEPGMSLKRHDNGSPWSLCRRPWTVMYFTANGRALPCCIAPFSQRGYENYTLGNATQQSLREIWTGPAYRAFRHALKSNKPAETCANCGLRWSL